MSFQKMWDHTFEFKFFTTKRYIQKIMNHSIFERIDNIPYKNKNIISHNIDN